MSDIKIVGTIDIKAIRRAVADYMSSEGCSCCRDIDAHYRHAGELAKLLRVKKYSDGSGYDFTAYRTKEPIKQPKEATHD